MHIILIPLSIIIILLISFVVVLLRRKPAWHKVVLIVCACTLFLILIFFTLKTTKNSLPNEQHFLKNYERMMKVVDLIEKGKLTPKSNEDMSGLLGERIILPADLKDLSRKGEVIYQSKDEVISILFATNTDIFSEHYYGYLYRSNGQPPSEDDFYEYIGFTKRLADKWFYNKASGEIK